MDFDLEAATEAEYACRTEAFLRSVGMIPGLAQICMDYGESKVLMFAQY